ncbi:DNA alkylation repair protein [Roseateles oligotrophus]|uniref:DNA alkylation repair protein n=1 Tax=Roseateles oligotrophus TaxID=1769250 RepID=A0ABT2YCU3_9BURK|nr:DNA alkylation repair protein [Roseateles oligotrophus]MCV2367857.1 DNA alkylation repair protein [Roseateles oligotrophus]
MAELKQALELLKQQARLDQLGAMARFGLTGDARLGLSMPALRSLGKQLGPDHQLALAMWDSAIPDAQILASLLADPRQLSVSEMNHWVAGMRSWDVCDQACLNAFRRSPLAWARIPVWARSDEEFVKRAAFSLLAVLAVHDKPRADADFIAMLPLIAAAADDERNFVKKSVNWALRQIGKRSSALLPQAIALAERLRERPEKAARWIATDALRELHPRLHA